jgi:hypothetical protein
MIGFGDDDSVTGEIRLLVAHLFVPVYGDNLLSYLRKPLDVDQNLGLMFF